MQNAPAILVTQTADIWQITHNGQTVAVIERAWDDYHWLLFLADAERHLVYQNAYYRVAALKVCFLLMARRNGAPIAKLTSFAA